MNYTTSTIDKKLHINFSFTAEEWENLMNKAYNQNKGKYNAPGFRKGHVPRKVLENNYGAGLFFEDALYLSANEGYGKYLEENKEVIPVASPAIDEKSIKSEGNGVSYDIVIVVKPDVTLGEYKALTIAKTAATEVTDADIDAELNRLQQRNSRMVAVTDRAIANDDIVNLDYSGSVDGVKFDGGTAEGQDLTIGSHQFIEGFEEKLVGLNIGDTRTIDVTFPEEYHAKDLAGKKAQFLCTINGINVRQLPELDDEFAKDVSECDTLEQYKAEIKANMTKTNEDNAAHKDEGVLVDTIVANATLDVPQEMIEEQVNEYVEEFSYQLTYQGLRLEDYLKYTNTTMEQLRETHTERAAKAVRTRLVLEAIVKQEGIEATEDEVNAKIAEYATQIGKEANEFEATLEPNQKAYFENQAITEKLIAMLKEQNTIA